MIHARHRDVVRVGFASGAELMNGEVTTVLTKEQAPGCFGVVELNLHSVMKFEVVCGKSLQTFHS